MKVYRYVIATDAGGAPNYDPPAVTLAICKPRIRRSARVGDLVMAFSGSSLSPEPHSVRWAGIVRETLTFAEYWEDPRFQTKKPGISRTPDNIYRVKNGRIEQVKNDTHGPESMATDISGEYVLVMDPVWVFGPAAPVLPEVFNLRITGGRRGHRVDKMSPGNWVALRSWLDQQIASVQRTPVAAHQPRRRCSPRRNRAPNSAVGILPSSGGRIEILKPNENPFEAGSKKALAWRIARGFGGCSAEECVAALDALGIARRPGAPGTSNRGYLREFHRRGLLKLEGYVYRPRM